MFSSDSKQSVENEDIQVSSEAQENYANNRNAESQLRVSHGMEARFRIKKRDI